MSNEFHDFGSSTPNFFLFKVDGVAYCLKEASIESTVLSGDFRLKSTDFEVDEDAEDAKERLKQIGVGKHNEAQLMLLESNIYVCDPEFPKDPLKAVNKIDPSIVRGWKTPHCKFLGDKLDEMSSMKDVPDVENSLGNS